MKRWLRQILAALGCVLAGTQVALPQAPVGQRYTQPYQTAPVLSPYMNLARPGTNPAINYFGLVRPQIQTGQNLQNLQQQIQQLDSTQLMGGTTAGAPVPGSMLTTGHPVVFFNYGPYFPFYGRGGRGAIGGAGTIGGGLGAANPVGFPLAIGIGFGNSGR